MDDEDLGIGGKLREGANEMMSEKKWNYFARGPFSESGGEVRGLNDLNGPSI